MFYDLGITLSLLFYTIPFYCSHENIKIWALYVQNVIMLHTCTDNVNKDKQDNILYTVKLHTHSKYSMYLALFSCISFKTITLFFLYSMFLQRIYLGKILFTMQFMSLAETIEFRYYIASIR